MGDYEKEQERLHRLMENILSESDIEEPAYDESSGNEDDVEEYHSEKSDTEQDISSEEEVEEFHEDISNSLSFLGKDKTTRWGKVVPQNKTMRTRRENIVKRLPGPSTLTRSLKDSIEIWGHFFNEDIINMITDCTNEFIDSISGNFDRPRDAKHTDKVEIRAFLGLLYMAGVYHANRLNSEDLWNTDGSGVEIFRLTMSLQRFRFLIRCIRFDSKRTRQERKNVDKLAPIREIFDTFVRQLQNGYHHSAYVTVDEMLAAFRGKCSFRQYIPSKPNKYGVKILALCDAKMFYTSKIEVYLGKQPAGPYQLSNTPYDVVHRLCSHIFGTGRNITMDNWFTSVPLISSLLREHRLTVIGTVRKNKRELPIEFTKPSKRPDHTSMFGFSKDCTLVSYIPKRNKNVLILSSMHHDDKINEDTGELHKPEMVTDYNSTKSGVVVVDKLSASYNCARNTRRWPMVVFYTLLNIAGINSQIIYCANNPETKVLRRKFLMGLASKLIQPHLKRRALVQNLPPNLKSRLLEICDNAEVPPRHEEAEGQDNQMTTKSGRCTYCGSKKNRKTRFFCFKCNKPMCLEHLIGMCQECRENAFQQP